MDEELLLKKEIPGKPEKNRCKYSFETGGRDVLKQARTDLGTRDSADAEQESNPKVDVGKLVVGKEGRQRNHYDCEEGGADGFLRRVAEQEEEGYDQETATEPGE